MAAHEPLGIAAKRGVGAGRAALALDARVVAALASEPSDELTQASLEALRRELAHRSGSQGTPELRGRSARRFLVGAVLEALEPLLENRALERRLRREQATERGERFARE